LPDEDVKIAIIAFIGAEGDVNIYMFRRIAFHRDHLSDAKNLHQEPDADFTRI
jgi:hypothetical protein